MIRLHFSLIIVWALIAGLAMTSKVFLPAILIQQGVRPDLHPSPYLFVGVFIVSLVAMHLHYRCYAYHWQKRTLATRRAEQRIIDDQIALSR